MGLLNVMLSLAFVMSYHSFLIKKTCTKQSNCEDTVFLYFFGEKRLPNSVLTLTLNNKGEGNSFRSACDCCYVNSYFAWTMSPVSAKPSVSV